MIRVRGEFQKQKLMEGFGQLRRRDLSCMGLYENEISTLQNQLNQAYSIYNSLLSQLDQTSTGQTIASRMRSLAPDFFVGSSVHPDITGPWAVGFAQGMIRIPLPGNLYSILAPQMSLPRQISELNAKEQAWQEQERLLLQEQTKAAMEEASQIEQLQMTIENLNMQLRANKNMNITLVEQTSALQDQINIFKDKISTQETLIGEQKAMISEKDKALSQLASEKENVVAQMQNQISALANENTELKTNLQSIMETGTVQQTGTSKLLTTAIGAVGGFIAAKSL